MNYGTQILSSFVLTSCWATTGPTSCWAVTPLTTTEALFLETLKQTRGETYFSDLLYAVTHQYFPPGVARDLWNQILRHKQDMSFSLKRNVRIAVASLDYLANLTTEMQSATVISEKHVADIVRVSQHDGLTGLYNHAYCYQRIDAELRTYARYGTVVSLMMIDVDDFKAINDRHGHEEGDRILALLGVVIQKTTRDTDFCCRYGGEEFAVILPATHIREAVGLADRLRTTVAQGLLCKRNATISIGVASCREDTRTPQALVKKADAALYQAKAEGKNRIVVAP
jgi:diguanylate cyclase (GGDEF)-like protein